MSLTILAIGDDDAAPGFLGERATQRGHELVCVSRYGSPDELRLDGVDVVMPLGSVWSVTDRGSNAWIERELDLLHEAITDEIPVLGVCFGGQELAAALGGAVERARRPELGWVAIDSDDAGVPAGPWFSWHKDELFVPDGVDVVATNESGVQAFRSGPHLGVQFHPEVTLEIIEFWCKEGASRLEELGISRDTLVAESSALVDGARARAYELMDGFLESVERVEGVESAGS